MNENHVPKRVFRIEEDPQVGRRLDPHRDQYAEEESSADHIRFLVATGQLKPLNFNRGSVSLAFILITLLVSIALIALGTLDLPPQPR